MPLGLEDLDKFWLKVLDDILQLNNKYNAYVDFERLDKYDEILDACSEYEDEESEYLRFKCIFKKCPYQS